MAETTVGELLRRYRKSAGLTQTDIAEKIPCKPSTVSRTENGEIHPSPEYIRSFCAIERLALTEAQQSELRLSGYREAQPRVPSRKTLHVQTTSHATHDAITTYRRRCIEKWRSSDYALDKNFIRIRLLHHHEQLGFFEPEYAREYDDLRDLLSGVENYSIVLLGPPGSGKSTLLRRLQMDFEQDGLNSQGEDETASFFSFFVALNRYLSGESRPRAWLSQTWQAENHALPPFETLLDEGRLLLLLDGLNEMPHRSAREYAEKVEQWRIFLQDVARGRNRAVFTCRSLDYSASLSSESFPIAHANVKPLNASQIEAFLRLHLPNHVERVFRSLRDNEALLSLYATPYHLSMLVKLIKAGGSVPQGRAELFTFIVRETLHREVCERKTALLLDPDLMSTRDLTQINTGSWRGYTLPERGSLIPRLMSLAFDMQLNRKQRQGGQVSIALEDALRFLNHPRSDDILRAGEHLGLIDEDLNKNQVSFSHQLFQEYFAARKLAMQPDPTLAYQEYRSDRVSPALQEILAGLTASDPLPPLPSSGWEETMQMAAALSDDPDTFVRDVSTANLPLAGLCASASDVQISDRLKNECRWALVHRSQDQQADLRARIAAGLALGGLGDPRFEIRNGPYGFYMLPPLVKIPAGVYVIGSDRVEGSSLLIKNPRHEVEIELFKMGAFPVTNAEFKYFIASGGYKAEQWWDTPASQAWLRGEGVNPGQVKFFREERNRVASMSEDEIYELVDQNKISITHAEGMLDIRNMSDAQFEIWLEGQCISGIRQAEPRMWLDPNFNNPNQPVIGICWYEARAYTLWLSAQSGLPFRLPTEAEWEAAARGVVHRNYPFGNVFDAQLCNSFESHIKKTTPIGIYKPMQDEAVPNERGEIYDLAGNAWEWTSSALLDYPYSFTREREDPQIDAEKRVIRGGSWLDSHHSLLAANRSHNHPAYRDYYVGFRLALSVEG